MTKLGDWSETTESITKAGSEKKMHSFKGVWVVLVIIGVTVSAYTSGRHQAQNDIQASCESNDSWTIINGKKYLCMNETAARYTDDALTKAYPNWPRTDNIEEPSALRRAPLGGSL